MRVSDRSGRSPVGQPSSISLKFSMGSGSGERFVLAVVFFAGMGQVLAEVKNRRRHAVAGLGDVEAEDRRSGRKVTSFELAGERGGGKGGKERSQRTSRKKPLSTSKARCGGC